MSRSISELLSERAGENFALHERHLNTQMVRVLRTIGFDRCYVRAARNLSTTLRHSVARFTEQFLLSLMLRVS